MVSREIADLKSCIRHFCIRLGLRLLVLVRAQKYCSIDENELTVNNLCVLPSYSGCRKYGSCDANQVCILKIHIRGISILKKWDFFLKIAHDG